MKDFTAKAQRTLRNTDTQQEKVLPFSASLRVLRTAVVNGEIE